MVSASYHNMEVFVKYKRINHDQCLISQFANFWKEEMFTDCTILCGGKVFPVHRLVLASCSEYFKKVFDNAQCCHPFIIMNEISPENLQILLNYIYQVNLEIPQKKLQAIIEEGQALKIKGFEAPNQLFSNTSSSAKSDVNVNFRLLQKSSPIVSVTKLGESHGDFSMKRKVPKEWDSEKKVRKVKDSSCGAKVKVIKNLVQDEDSLPSLASGTTNLDNIVETSEENEGNFIGLDGHRKQVLNERQAIKEEEEILPFPLEKSLTLEVLPSISQSTVVSNQRQDEEVFDEEIIKEVEEEILPFPLEKARSHESLPSNSRSTGLGKLQREVDNLSKKNKKLKRKLKRKGKVRKISLPNFSEFVQPYLDGTAEKSKIPLMRQELIYQLKKHLDENNLLNSSNTMEQSWGYRHLRRALFSRYPNIICEISTRKNVGNSPLSMLISRLGDARNRAKLTLKKQFHTPESALKIVKNAEKFDQLALSEKKRALTLSRSLRSMPLTLKEFPPPYLRLSPLIVKEIELLFDKTIAEMDQILAFKLKRLKKMFKISSPSDLLMFLSSSNILKCPIPDEVVWNGAFTIYKNTPNENGRTIISVSEGFSYEYERITLSKGLLVILGLYYILDISYLSQHSQIMGFLQEIVVGEKFPQALSGSNLKSILKFIL